ncbi:MAG: small multi-drug export protein, partial [Lachnospiraceae bacterium]|nr:small multi-drug export protein [Lachnospiraceae bacterium]
MEHLVSTILYALKGHLSKEIIVFIIPLFPILELRGGLLAASIMNVPLQKAIIASVIGNILPIPFILLLLEHILVFMEKWHPTKKIAIWLRKKAEK